MGEYERVGREVNCFRVTLKRLESGGDIFCSPYFGRCHFDEAERAGCCLNFGHFYKGSGVAGIAQDRQPAETRNNLAQKFESLTRKIGRLEGKAGDVAARPPPAGD